MGVALALLAIFAMAIQDDADDDDDDDDSESDKVHGGDEDDDQVMNGMSSPFLSLYF